MIRTLLFVIMLSINIAFAGDPDHCANCKPTLSGLPSSGVEDLTKLASVASREKELRSLAQGICGYFSMDRSKIAVNVKSIIKKYMKKLDNIDDPTPAQIISFLNKNKNQMLCDRGKTHYMVASFQSGTAYNMLFNTLFFDELVTDDTEEYIDVNAISYTGKNSSPETVLDYMHREVKENAHMKEYIKEVQSLINTFEIDLGGKRYAELPESEKVH
jgi:hypothetical protein